MTEMAFSPGISTSRSAPRYSLNEKIDLCRGIFAFLVVSAHAMEMAGSLDPAGSRMLWPWLHGFLTYVAGTGLYYVMGFFVLSGYCIQLSVMRLARDGVFPLKTYMMARLTRILPLYYLALLVTVIIEHGFAGTRAPVWSNGISRSVLLDQVLVVQNFTQTYGSFAPSWSITNELVYYVMFGLLAAFLARTRVRPATLGMVVCIAVGAVTHLLYRSGFRSATILSTGLLFGLGFNWFLGALVAVHVDWLVRMPVLRLASRFWGLLLALTMLLWLSQRVHLEFIYLGAGIAFTLLLIRFLVVDARSSVEPDRKPAPLPALLGLASYPTYLFHGPILLMVGSMLKNWGLTWPWWLVWLVGTCVAISSGLILGYLAERPIMVWRAGYLKRLRQTHKAAAHGGVAPILGIQQ